jgi:FKBP-type peptidyl-prolyl cis-trans isomerase (trigger factor)
MTKKDPQKKSKQPSLISENSKITLVIPKKQAREVYDKILKKLAKTIKSEGFRKGKVPTKIAEEKLGLTRLINETLQEIIPESYLEEIKKQKKQPLTNPEFKPLSLTWEKDWQIEAFFPEPPKFELGKYQAIAKKAIKTAHSAMQNRAKDKEAKKLDKSQEKESKLQHIFKDLVTSVKPQVPELLLRYETKAEYDRLQANLKQIKMSVDQYLEKRKIDKNQLTNEMATTALGRLQLDFILGAIAKDIKATVADKDVEKHLDQIKDKKAVVNLKKDNQYLTYLKTALIKQKVVDHLLKS